MNKSKTQGMKKVLSITLILLLLFSMGGCAKKSYLQSLDKEIVSGGWVTLIFADKEKTMAMSDSEFYDFATNVLEDYYLEAQKISKVDFGGMVIVEFEDGTGIQFANVLDGFAEYVVVDPDERQGDGVLGNIYFDDGKVLYKTKEQEELESQERAKLDEYIILDNLQKLYLKLDDVTKDEIEREVEESGLFSSENKYASGPSIKIAFTEGVSKHKYADSGDNIKISFNKNLEVEHIVYFNNKKFLELLDYRKGTYWDLRDQPEYAGYYINKPGGSLGSFTVKYDNGNEADTGYLKVDSKEEQLNFLHKYFE